MITAASTNTTMIAWSVPSGAAPEATFWLVGSRYGHCATPHAMTTVATAPIARKRAKWKLRRTSSTSEPMPQIAETITSGSAREVRPSKT